MAEGRRKFDEDFKQGAVRIVRETGKPIAQVARELGINEGTLGNWCVKDRRQREGSEVALSEDERAELVRLRRENAELAMQRDVLKRSVALWVNRRWNGERGWLHRRPEGSVPDSPRDGLSGVGSESGLVLQVVARDARRDTPAESSWRPRSSSCSPPTGSLRIAPDHRRPARGGLAGECEHCGSDHG